MPGCAVAQPRQRACGSVRRRAAMQNVGKVGRLRLGAGVAAPGHIDKNMTECYSYPSLADLCNFAPPTLKRLFFGLSEEVPL